MVQEEKDACKFLKRTNAAVDTAGGLTLGQKLLQKEEPNEGGRIRVKRGAKEDQEPYKNADCVLGSAAEAERAWSVARYILTTLRSKVSPELFNALNF